MANTDHRREIQDLDYLQQGMLDNTHPEHATTGSLMKVVIFVVALGLMAIAYL